MRVNAAHDGLLRSMAAAAGDRKTLWVSEDSIKRLAKNQRLPLRRITPFATPGVLESELFAWLKSQPRVGPPVRSKRRAVRKRQ